MEENKYQRGKIYKIISPHTDKIYIGSTCKKYLSQRIAVHKCQYNKWCLDNNNNYTSSYELLKLGDVEFILIESYQCNNKDELNARERYYMELNKDKIVNKIIPTRTKKQYNEDHKDHIKENKKEYYQKNKEDLLKKSNQRYKDNKDKNIQTL
jgi:hypothetical protein